MTVDDLETLYDYSYWANEKLLRKKETAGLTCINIVLIAYLTAPGSPRT